MKKNGKEKKIEGRQERRKGVRRSEERRKVGKLKAERKEKEPGNKYTKQDPQIPL